MQKVSCLTQINTCYTQRGTFTSEESGLHVLKSTCIRSQTLQQSVLHLRWMQY